MIFKFILPQNLKFLLVLDKYIMILIKKVFEGKNGWGRLQSEAFSMYKYKVFNFQFTLT
jgi:hypothetical protein